MSNSKPSLAVIGTGLAGLSAAYLLKHKYNVSVFESQAKAGMGVHTIEYCSQGKNVRIDVPLRIFCKGYYKNLTALYNHIGVDINGSDHSGIFTNDDGKLLLHYGKFTFKGLNIAYPKGQSIYRASTFKLAYQSKCFFMQASRSQTNLKGLNKMSFGEYLQASQTPKELSDTILLPLLSVTLTCDYQSVLNYPAELILEYLTCGIAKDGIIGAEKGVDDIVPRLLTNVDLKVNAGVKKISQEGEKILLSFGDNKALHFDHVVIASQAQQAASILKGFDSQKLLLESVPVERSEMSVHTDSGLLPNARSKLSPVSYYIPNRLQRPEVTVNLTQAFTRYSQVENIYQTWNPIRQPVEGSELARVSFTRPTVTLESRAAIKKLRQHQQKSNNQLWFCGSYMADKIPLLDAAVDSSVSIAKSLGVSIPWESNV